MISLVARRLGMLREKVVFLGGAAISLFLTDPGLTQVRITGDVDAIVEVVSWVAYHKLEESLRDLGFKHATDRDAPMCRWSIEGVIVDIMPTSEEILGFSNRWHSEAMQHTKMHKLDDDLEIRLVTAPYFLATKIEAFLGRGHGDFQSSHDIEDIITVIDGRRELVEEIRASSPELRAYLSEKFNSFLKDDAFLDSLPGHLLPDSANQARGPSLLDRVKQIARLTLPV